MTNSASKRSRLRPLFTLAIAACAVGAIYLGIGYYVYLQLARGTYGHGADDGNTPAGFHLNGDAYPDFDVTSYLCPDYQDVVIAGGDPGIDLAGWWIPGEVGETAIIEDNVSILHEVTLGGTGNESGARHPIVRSGVLIGAGAKILGRVEIGQGAKIGAGSVGLEDVPPHTTGAGVPAEIVGASKEESPAHAMDQSLEVGESLESSGL